MFDQETVTLIRDILVSAYLVVGILVLIVLLVAAFLLVKAVRRLLGSMTKTVDTVNDTLDNVNRASGAVLNYVSSPAAEGSTASLANGLGILINFVGGLRGKTK
ncbi:MAG: hypothetical protein F4185_00105 [Chloroflexi bacterium]|nr:hypothetical protein [Chloroflexota bacterium]MYF64440.1 hypothetical protein [Chloroflexota bacterium]MYK35650.1 hypothetical protein [Chloroflexota bacterium]